MQPANKNGSSQSEPQITAQQTLVAHDYNEESIKSLDWREHIRLRPGMYIGKLGDGTSTDDGIYILIKEVMDNSIDEYTMGYGKRIDIHDRRKAW